MIGKMQVLKDFCDKILECDKTIRYAGIADKLGRIVVTKYRVAPLLSIKESELSVKQSTIRMKTRKTLETKIGKTIYAFALYEKMKRATIPLRNGSILMLSFNKQADHHSIIVKKILPLIKKYGLREN